MLLTISGLVEIISGWVITIFEIEAHWSASVTVTKYSPATKVSAVANVSPLLHK